MNEAKVIFSPWVRRKLAFAVMAAVCLGSALVASAQKLPSDETQQRRDKDDPRARAEYLAKKRSGGQPVPPGARLRAMRLQERMMQNEGKRFWERTSTTSAGSSATTTPQTGAASPERTSAPPPLSASQWVFIGPQPTNPNPANGGGGNHFSGRVTALAVDPSDATGNKVFLGAAQGGVWKTTDGGVHWAPLTDNQPSLAVGSIAIDATTTPSTLYVGTGEENFGSDSYYGVGILKSTDCAGSVSCTWTLIPASNFTSAIPECSSSSLSCGGPKIGSLAIQPGTGGGSAVILAAVQNANSNTGGLYRSQDGGTSWLPVISNVTADMVVWASSSVAYAAIDGDSPAGTSGVYISSGNGGNIFNLVPGNSILLTVPGGLIPGRIALASDPTNPAILYASVEGTTNSPTFQSLLAGFYKTTDSGTSWTKMTNIPDYCGGGQVIQGVQQNSYQCFYDNVIAVNPANSQVIFAGGSGFPNPSFVVMSSDGGTSWITVNTNIHADQHAMAFVATNGPSLGKLYIGNDGGAYSTTDTGINPASVTWTELNTTLGITQFYGYFAIDPNDSLLTYGGTQDNGTQMFSGDMFWDEVTCGDGAGAVIDSNSGRIFANCNDVDIRESDTGSPGSFNNLDTSAITNSGDSAAFIPPMVGDHSSPMRLYFGTNRVWQQAQSAVSPVWNVISSSVTNGGKISNMEVSPDGNTMYVVSEDGRVSQGTGLTVGAGNFTDVTGIGQFPAGAFISAVRISPADSTANTAYISITGFNDGQHIFKTTTGGFNWANASGFGVNKLPNTPVNDLVLDPDLPGTLYAATDIGVFVTHDDGATWATLTMSNPFPRVAVLGLQLHRGSRTLRAATHGRGMWDLYVPICGSGPCLTLSPSGLNFGNQAVGTSSATQTITVTNTAAPALTIFSVTPSGDYSQTNNCGGSIPQNGTCAITVTFTPQSAFKRTGKLTIVSNAALATPPLTGTGIVTPANDNFANAITIGSLPFSATVVTNGATSQASDPIPPLACVGVYNPSDPLGYATSPTFNHHSIWFNYTPQNTGTVTLDTLTSNYDTVLSVWTFANNTFTAVAGGCNDDVDAIRKTSQINTFNVNGGTTYHILVTGYYANSFGTLNFHMAVVTGSPSSQFTLSSGALNFSTVLGRVSAPQAVTITNNSGSPQNITGVLISGNYSLTQNCPPTLNIGASCAATVIFTPTTVGQQNGLLTFVDSASSSPQTIPLTGFGFNFTINQRRPGRSSRNGGVVQGQRRQFDLALDTATGGGTLPVSVSCEGAPARATCTVSPSRINTADGSTPVTVTLQTSAGTGGAVSRVRARRLSISGTAVGSAGTPVGSYNLKVIARVGDAESDTFVPVTVIAPARASRLTH